MQAAPAVNRTAVAGRRTETTKMRITGRNIIVIGTSAGGREALDDLIGQLPTDLPAPIFLVQHMAPENTGETLVHRLSRQKAFGCALATDGAPFKRGRIYIAPPCTPVSQENEGHGYKRRAREQLSTGN
jgi:chemotaxis response regulator CheB